MQGLLNTPTPKITTHLAIYKGDIFWTSTIYVLF